MAHPGLSGGSAREAKVSLWLVPAGEGRERLRDLIEALAHETGGPAFPPHVTLVSSEAPLGEVLAALERSMDPPRAPAIPLVRAATGESFFQSVLMEVEPTGDLKALRRGLEGLPGVKPSAWRPHLSLAYGDLASAQKEALLADPRVRALEGTTLRAGAIEVWVTGDAMEAWRLERRVELPA